MTLRRIKRDARPLRLSTLTILRRAVTAQSEHRRVSFAKRNVSRRSNLWIRLRNRQWELRRRMNYYIRELQKRGVLKSES